MRSADIRRRRHARERDVIGATEALARFRSAPVVGLDAIVHGGLLVLAPHPDDESLGCGGLIAKAVEAGIAVHVAVLTDGAGSHPNSRRFPPPALARLRAEEVLYAAKLLGVEAGRVHFLGVRDSNAPHEGAALRALSDAVATLLDATGSTTLLSTWAHDPHTDHRAAHLIALSAARRAGARLRSYPVWGWTLGPEHQVAVEKAVRLDVCAQLAKKRRAIAAHRSQCSDLIDDDPDGFRLRDDFIAVHTGPWEVFIGGR